MIPREQQFAEKLHAYTLPRKGAVNSRVRDLVDMVLLIQSSTLRGDMIADAVRITFARRRTHNLPKALPQPPADWGRPYNALARECGLMENADDGFATVKSFLGGTGILGRS
jgi:hypothetical protein